MKEMTIMLINKNNTPMVILKNQTANQLLAHKKSSRDSKEIRKKLKELLRQTAQ